LLNISRSILGAETSERSGSADFIRVLKKSFPSIKWQALNVHGENTVFYYETKPENKKIDLLCYTNIDTANPSHLSLWTKTDFDPLAITLNKGVLFGLGAAHEKISIVPQALAMEEFIKSKSKKKSGPNIVIAAGFGRESKMRGAKRLLLEFLKDREINKICVANATENEVFYGSAGRLKTKVFFPFSEKEKELRAEHDLKENISSQSKIYSFLGGETLESNTVHKVISSCKNLPIGTVILDLDGGSSTVTEPETTYFEVDFAVPFENSMVSKFENFGELLIKLDAEMKSKFGKHQPSKALHIGRAFDSEEGVTFFGYNLIPAGTTRGELDDWFNSFREAVQSVGGEVMITDAKTPYINLQTPKKDSKMCLNVTEASVFEKICKNIIVLGPGKSGASKQPNESVLISDLAETAVIYYDLFNDPNLSGVK
jgi:hypothetical protein